MNTTVTNTVNLVLQQDVAQRLTATNTDLSNAASFLVGEYAQGGIMMRHDQIGYISTYCNAPIRTSSDVVEIVENAVNRRSMDGSLVITYKVDPAFARPLEEVAHTQGRTVDAALQEAISIVLSNSWLYSLEVSGGTLNLDREGRERLESLVGGHVENGTWLVGYIADLQKKIADLESVNQVSRWAEDLEIHDPDASPSMPKKLTAVQRARELVWGKV